MATIEQIEPRIQYRDQMAGAQTSLLRPPFITSIRWGAVIAGVAVGTAVQLMLALFGLASGLFILGAAGEDMAGYASWAWAGISMLTSAFVGGYVTARMSGMRRKIDGALHGAVSWAVTTLFLVFMVTSAAGSLMNGVFANVWTDPVRSTQSNDAGVTVLLRAQLGGEVGPADFQTLLHYVQSGQREEAILLLSSMGMDPERAGVIVDQAISAASRMQQGDAQNPETRGRGMDAASSAAWIFFAVVFLSLLLGMGGGVVGAVGARRMIWKKEDKAASRPNLGQS